MSTCHIYPYKFGSRSAKTLSVAMGKRRVKAHGAFRGNFGGKVINWGNTEQPSWYHNFCMNGGQVLNGFTQVNIAKNKLDTFAALEAQQVSTVPWTTDRSYAEEWSEEGHKVIGRRLLEAHSGRGVEVYENWGEFRDVPLYTRYVKKTAEMRVHVCAGAIIDYAQKRRSRSVPDDQVNWEVRNHQNGWIFARDDIVLPAVVGETAVAAVEALGLDFGAVDIIWNQHYNAAYVLEVNTAPGLEGQTVGAYKEAMFRLCQ